MEKLDVYDINGNKTGKVIDRGVTLDKGEYVLAAVVIVKSADKYLITKRAKEKSYSMMWEFPGGCVVSKEESINAAVREIGEETGIIRESSDMELLGKLVCEEFRLLADIYITQVDVQPNTIKLQKCETIDSKLVSVDEMDNMYDQLTPVDKMIYDEFVVMFD